ncbi:MAG: glycosyltransferase family 2 protein [bacterium]|nr:glycosyltransferase family 2 protein [bacterium]
MSKIKLSICIPTYQRENWLKECLGSLVPQITSDEVEVVVVDNCSQDNTTQVVNDFVKNNQRIRYYRNERNLGYSGGQAKCFEYSRGDYTAILCDDDVYLDGEVAEIFKVINQPQEYALIALNYYNFVENYQKPHKADFCPEKDLVFKRAYDILHYPSVGHYSAVIFNMRLARQKLPLLDLAAAEKHRGIISELAVRVTAGSNLPAYFIGARKLAVRIPFSLDYDTLKHLCIDEYEFYSALYKEGIITEADLACRINWTMIRLPKAIIKDWSKLDTAERKAVSEKLIGYFSNNESFIRHSLPLLNWGKNSAVRSLYRLLSWMAAEKRKLVCTIRK